MRAELPDAGRYKQGTVVQHVKTGDYGHIVGFSRVEYDSGHSIAIKVLWDDGEVRSTHFNNLILV